ncbi:MAG: hypothetical protein GXO55_00705 [Chloroflexi bacterium]|nr:hypothetical protein [Chloroflexota bacterium]
MLLRTTLAQRWDSVWTSVVPRTRLGTGLTHRHLMAVGITFILGALIAFYLYLVGQVALIEYQTEQTILQRNQLIEANAHLEHILAPYFSVQYIAQQSEHYQPIRATRVGERHLATRGVQPAEQTPASRSHLREWARMFHLDGQTHNLALRPTR